MVQVNSHRTRFYQRVAVTISKWPAFFTKSYTTITSKQYAPDFNQNDYKLIILNVFPQFTTFLLSGLPQGSGLALFCFYVSECLDAVSQAVLSEVNIWAVCEHQGSPKPSVSEHLKCTLLQQPKKSKATKIINAFQLKVQNSRKIKKSCVPTS